MAFRSKITVAGLPGTLRVFLAKTGAPPETLHFRVVLDVVAGDLHIDVVAANPELALVAAYPTLHVDSQEAAP